MTKEEKDVIDSFEGKTSYEAVVNNADYYLFSALQTNLPLMIEQK